MDDVVISHWLSTRFSILLEFILKFNYNFSLFFSVKNNITIYFCLDNVKSNKNLKKHIFAVNMLLNIK